MLADTSLLRGAKGRGVCWILEGVKLPCLRASPSLEPAVLSGAQSAPGSMCSALSAGKKAIRTISECCVHLHTASEVSVALS